MKQIKAVSLFICALTLLCGCRIDTSKHLKKALHPDDDVFAREYIMLVKERNYEKAYALLDPEMAKRMNESLFNEVSDLLDKGEIIDVENVAISTFTSSNGDIRKSKLTYQLSFKDSFQLFIIKIETVGTKMRVKGLSGYPIAKPLRELYAFSFKDKKMMHYIFLFLLFAIPAMVIYSIVLCFKMNLKRKWLWIIFSLCGVLHINFDWVNGIVNIPYIISLHIPVVLVYKIGLNPWTISLSIPVGAAVIIIKYLRFNKCNPK